MSTKLDYSSIAEVLFSRSINEKDLIAFTYLEDGEDKEINLTYEELNKESRKIAQVLLTICKKGDRALLFYPAGLEFIKVFFGCLYAGVIAVPTFPPRMNRSLDRLDSIMNNCDAKVILTESSITRNKFFKDKSDKYQVLETDLIRDEARNGMFPISEIKPEDIAFLQYTSGSTGSPKGVIVTHGNILANQELIRKKFNQNKESVIVGWLPFYHDMGLIGNILHPVCMGSRSILMSPQHFLQKPLRWLKAISKYKATTSGGPNFAYDLCVEKISKEDKAFLDLSTWQTAFSGAEPVRLTSLKRFVLEFKQCRFQAEALQPCYGMAEATLLISASPHGKEYKFAGFARADLQYEEEFNQGKKEDAPIDLISCGDTNGFEVKIVDNKKTEREEGKVGEIWIRGESVARGYWNKPDETEEFFNAQLLNGEGPYFRTGDLGLIKEGELYVAGRLKDLIIINGRNLYPNDIEDFVYSLDPAIIKNNGAAFSIEKDSKEVLVIVCEIDEKKKPDFLNLKTTLKKAISEEFQIDAEDVVFIRRGSISKTTSGKIQRNACRRSYENNQLSVISYQKAIERLDKDIIEFKNDFERVLHEKICSILDLKYVNPEENFFHLGFDSIKIAQIGMTLSQDFGLDMELVFENPSIRLLGAQLEKTPNDSIGSFQLAPQLPYYKLAPIQKGMWFDQQLKGESNSYNIPVLVDLFENTDVAILKKIINTIFSEHEIFRAAFVIHNDEPVIKIERDSTVDVPVINIDSVSDQDPALYELIKKEASGPFQLGESPLIRIRLLKASTGTSKLLVVAHHIITDGTSLTLFGEEILKRYKAEMDGSEWTASIHKFQYKDYLAYYSNWLESDFSNISKSYWKERLKDVSEFRLSGDFSIYDKTNKKSKSLIKRIPSYLSNDLKEFSRKNQVSLYATLQTGFLLLLSKYSGKKEMVIASPVSGRTRLETINIFGPLINTVFLNYKLEDNESCESLLRNVQSTTIEALKHQLYPLEWLIEDLKLNKQATAFPLTSVFFNGLFFLDENSGTDPFKRFPNLNIDLNIDLNVYIASSDAGIDFRFDYKEVLFKEKTIQRLLDEYEIILKQLISSSDQPVRKIINKSFNNISADEREQIVRLANGTSSDYPPGEHIASLIEKQVLETPESIAVVCGDQRITYYDLNSKANALAKLLISKGVKQGDFVSMFMDKSLEIPVSMLALMKIGAAYVPMDLDWPINRINALLEDLKPAYQIFNKRGLDLEVNKAFPRMVFEYADLSLDEINPGFGISLDTPIYGMYTSGTTGLPKCTINIQRGILNRLLYMNKRYGRNSEESVLFGSKYDYDACVWQIFWPMLNGGKTVIPTSRQDNDLHEIVNLICQEKITFTDFVPSVFNVFVDYLESGKEAVKKSESLRQLLIGGEAMNSKAIKRFRDLLPHTGITNTYGATEASMGTVFYELGEEIVESIPIGKPIDNVRGVILDEQLELTPFGEVGELYLGGDCVGLGYLNEVEKTNKAFIKNPIQEIKADKLYKTGDLVSYMPDGNIKCIGRKDLQIKIKGIRIELGEIEKCLLQHREINEAVVLSFKDEADEIYLVAYLASQKELSKEEIIEYLKKWLPEYMVPAAYVEVNVFPRIGIGKVDKRALALIPHQKLSKQIEFIAPITEAEIKLAGIWGNVLKKDTIGIHNNFFDEGGDSLKAMKMLTQIHKEMNVKVSLRDIFIHPTIAMLSKALPISKAELFEEIKPVQKSESYKMSRSQKRFWILSQFPESSLAYNLSGAIQLEGTLEVDLLEKALRFIVGRHESLRTIFKEDQHGEVQQFVLPIEELKFNISYDDICSKPDKENYIKGISEQEQKIPFDLGKCPLFRFHLLKLSNHKWVFIYTMHHIISDGSSMEILIKELVEVYNAFKNQYGPDLDTLRIQYRDYSSWHNDMQTGENMKKHEEYWLDQFSGELPILDMPSSNLRPAIKTHYGASIRKKISADITEKLKGICAQEGSTLFMGLLSSVHALFFRYTGQEDIIVGSPIAGRDHSELENQIGLYLNTLALRTRFSGEDSFIELLNKTKEVLLGAYLHQSYPFDMLIDKLHLQRDLSRSPLFDVMIILQNQYTDEVNVIDGLKIEPYEGLEKKTSQFDLAFEFREDKEGLLLDINYNTDIYLKSIIENLIVHFEQLLRNILIAPGEAISSVEYLAQEERHKLLVEFNNTDAEFPHDKTIVDLFEEQVEKTPASIAVIFEEAQLTYFELNEKSNQLAHYLKTNYQIGPDEPIGIRVDRSENMIIGLLGILKSGGAYVPIDPLYPETRINYILENSGSKVLIVDSKLNSESINTIDQISLSEDKNSISLMSGDNIKKKPAVSNLAYVIYTSGSTGNPKGVMVEHSGVVNRIYWMWNKYNFNTEDTIFQKTPYVFDVSVWELFLTLSFGAKMVLCRQEVIYDPVRLIDHIEKYKITTLHFVPSMFKAFVDVLNKKETERIRSIRQIFTSGEALLKETVKKYYKRFPVILHNLYGPTEASVDVSYYATGIDDDVIPIGKPISNIKLHILDRHQRLVPIGILGEICISGIGLARGYINNKELTAEKFISNLDNGGERLYRTGDVGRWLPDGNIEYIGRKDDQVKIRGYRIELGEIEAVIQRYEEIVSAAVIAKAHSNREKELVAYIVSKSDLNASDIRAYLNTALPSYMLPSQIVQLEELPLTPNGKVDRKRLPNPEGIGMKTGTKYVAPRNETEEKLTLIWQKLLEKEKIGIKDNFFELGGHSLKAIQLVSLIHKEFQVRVKLKSLFSDPTISKLSDIVRAEKWIENSKNVKKENRRITEI